MWSKTIAGQELSVVSLVASELNCVLLDMRQGDRDLDTLLMALAGSLGFSLCVALPFISSVSHTIIDTDTLLSHITAIFDVVIL